MFLRMVGEYGSRIFSFVHNDFSLLNQSLNRFPNKPWLFIVSRTSFLEEGEIARIEQFLLFP